MSTAEDLPLDLAREVVARSLLLDLVMAEVSGALRAAGVPNVALKGAALAGWLYRDGRPRAYYDADVLVPPASTAKAGEVLAGLGFGPQMEEEDVPPNWTLHGYHWHRPTDWSFVDLHVTLPGIGVSPETAWAVLSEATEPMRIGGDELQVLDEPARALHVALHAAHNGAAKEKSMADLELAIATLPRRTWEGAAELATRLNAAPAFAEGLKLLPDGELLAGELRVAGQRSVEATLHARHGPHANALTVQRFSEVRGLGPRLRFLRGVLFPSPGAMRRKFPRAERSTWGLLLTYALRPALLIRDAPGALRDWRAVRRDVARQQDPR